MQLPISFNPLDVPGTRKVILPFFLVIPVLYLMPSAEGTYSVGVATFIAIAGILRNRLKRYQQTYWSSIREPIAVVDHGKFGRGIIKKLPPELRPFVITCFAGNVEHTMIKVQNKLISVDNIYLNHPTNPIYVYPVYFAYGSHINEDHKEDTYINRVIETMEKVRLEFHTKAAKDEQYYKSNYINTGLNGSV